MLIRMFWKELQPRREAFPHTGPAFEHTGWNQLTSPAVVQPTPTEQSVANNNHGMLSWFYVIYYALTR